MKIWLALSVLCYFVAIDDDKTTVDYSRQNDLLRDALKGRVQIEQVWENNRATWTNNQWTITDSSIVCNITSYDKKGYVLSTKELLRNEVVIQSESWIDEDGLHNTLLRETGNEDKPELIIREFQDDTTLLIKTYKTDDDTIIYNQLEEEVRTYTDYGIRRDYYSVKGEAKKRYLYNEKHIANVDTSYLNYYGESSARYTHAVLARDGAGNAIKILVYTDTDTTLTIKRYTYY